MNKNKKSTVPEPELRDWFAGMALQGFIASITTTKASNAIIKECDRSGQNIPQYFADVAYNTADAMLAERKKGME